jgi:hypothetical protein
MTREGMLFFTRSYKSRFLDYAVNFRLYNRPDTPYILLDTLGMQVLSMPDVQYFFKDINPRAMMIHARSILDLLMDEKNPIQDDDLCDSIRDFEFNRDVV